LHEPHLFHLRIVEQFVEVIRGNGADGGNGDRHYHSDSVSYLDHFLSFFLAYPLSCLFDLEPELDDGDQLEDSEDGLTPETDVGADKCDFRQEMSIHED